MIRKTDLIGKTIVDAQEASDHEWIRLTMDDGTIIEICSDYHEDQVLGNFPYLKFEKMK